MPTHKPTSAKHEVTVVSRMPHQSAKSSGHLPSGVSIKSCSPSGVRQNINGTRKAGSVYFQAWIMVGKGLPPQMAEAANGAKAVGGDTSANTA